MIIRNEIRNRMTSARSFTFRRAIRISRSEEDAHGRGGRSTGEEGVKTGSEAGTFGRSVYTYLKSRTGLVPGGSGVSIGSTGNETVEASIGNGTEEQSQIWR